MRKGFLLVEMIGVLMIMTILAIMMVKPMRNITRNIPHIHQDYQSSSIMNDMLDDLRKDVESAKGLMEYQGNTSGNGDMLLIDSPEGVISYSFQDGKVIRFKEIRDGMAISDTQVVWSVPSGKIEWQLRAHNGKDVAVEISTGINRRGPGGMKTNLKNSHVIFFGVNAFSEKL